MPGQAAKSQTGEKKGLDRAEEIKLAFAGAVPITAAEFGLPTEIRDRRGNCGRSGGQPPPDGTRGRSVRELGAIVA
jgi:hypothetical protein